MRIILDSTPEVLTVDGVQVRKWKGRTSKGVEVTAYVLGLRVLAAEDLREFNAELTERPVPEPLERDLPRAFSNRHLL